LCPACRERLNRASGRGGSASAALLAKTACFNCYRASLEHARAIKAAGELDTASVERFQWALPFEPVNTARLETLKADRSASRRTMRQGAGQYVDRRRRAQIEARHTLQTIFQQVRAQRIAAAAREQQIVSAIHAAELQLPESWLRFVVAR
jgi:hypothetical protein